MDGTGREDCSGDERQAGENLEIAFIEDPVSNMKRTRPTGMFYICDGIHKTLVLSTLLFSGQSAFQPLEAILLTPRR